MQAYSQLNALLRSPKTDYSQFQAALMKYDISQQTYLNLFLTTVAIQKARHPEFAKYVHLLTHFRHYTGKKQADINCLGYKDRISVLMHTCARGNAQSISTLLAYSMLDLHASDPNGKNAAFYAIKNPNQQTTNQMLILLFQHHPQYIRSEANNGYTLINEAIDELKCSTVELLLRVGANPNSRLLNSGNTISHVVVKLYIHHKELVNKLIVILLKYKANFDELNGLGKTVFETAKDVGLNLSDCREESVDEVQNQFDKQSILTLNQQTKIQDSVSVSEIFQIQSNICSQQVDFSQLDDQEDIENEVYQPEKEEGEIIKVGQDNNLQENHFQSDKEDNQSNSNHQINFEILSEQILTFSTISQQEYRNSWQLMEPFFKSIQKIAQKYGLTLQIVGSFATGLWSNYSDINMNLIPVSTDYINFESVLDRIYKKLKARRLELSIDNIVLNKNKINSIKLELGPKYNNQKLDIGIFHRNNQNRNYVNFITENMEAHPQIKHLFFICRKLCQTFNLHDPLQGGLKTYTLFLMINLVVKSIPTDNIGHLFYHLTLYYGFYFQYDFEAKDNEQQELQKMTHLLDYPIMRFNLMDPLNPKNNMGGKSTKTQEMQNMFRAVYYHLCTLSSQPYLQQLFQLHSIF